MIIWTRRQWQVKLLACIYCCVLSAVSSAQTRMVPSTMTQIATGINLVSGLATDAKGNLFVLDGLGIHEWLAVNGVITAT